MVTISKEQIIRDVMSSSSDDLTDILLTNKVSALVYNRLGRIRGTAFFNAAHSRLTSMVRLSPVLSRSNHYF